MIRKKWWQTKAVEGSHQWCVIKVMVGYHVSDRWDMHYKEVYKPCHITNMPTNTTLITKNIMQHEAQSLCKLLNQGELK